MSSANQLSTNVYDAVGNKTVEQYASGSLWVTFTYDALNRVQVMQDSLGLTTNTYSARGEFGLPSKPCASPWEK